ncbi:hypothetical protein C2845_PM14G11270 [Panicum miliaceum]|uniref:F-box domain-containing protein n=1 Tax=Panicum miliaceum TaxID=4540 RepID=A0A3L6PT07_PANMI|nr:hypothetical protein C2845_PM14G11270 [Panicum miliaceum]
MPDLPLEDEDLLGEYLLRLPPQPSSLPRASLVCKQWRRLVSTHEAAPPRLLLPRPRRLKAAGDRLPVAIPPVFDRRPYKINGAIVCATGDEGHTHGDCRSNPFQVITVGTSWEGVSACVYSSATDAWGNLISALWPSPIPPGAPSHPFFFNDCRSTLVGSCIYWLIVGLRASILKFDLGAQSLAVIEAPPNVYQVQALVHRKRQFLITPADGGAN